MCSYPFSLLDSLPISSPSDCCWSPECGSSGWRCCKCGSVPSRQSSESCSPPSAAGSAISDRSLGAIGRSEEHTSELQSRGHLVCRLLLEKKKKENQTI